MNSSPDGSIGKGRPKVTWNKKIVFIGHLTVAQEHRLRKAFPDVIVAVCRYDPERIRQEICDAHIICGRIKREEFLETRRLEFIQSMFVGVEGLCYPELVHSGVAVANGRGIFSHAMAEHVLALMLALHRQLPAMLRAQAEMRWQKTEETQLAVLEGKTVGLLGLGSIGQRIAKLCKAFDAATLGMNQSGRPVEHVDTVLSSEALPELLTASDVVVNTLPHTPQTRHLLGAEQFRRMKASALFINVGRGKTVDEAALVEALREGRIAGAGLDVFEREPLPLDSPLWGMANVIISPHQSGDEPTMHDRGFDLLLENLRRRRDGEPLLNLVDLSRGY